MPSGSTQPIMQDMDDISIQTLLEQYRINQSNPIGRPTVVDDSALLKLEEAFAYGCTDKEACIFAGISEKTLYVYQNKNPEFVQRKEQLKETPVLLMRRSVIQKGQKDGNLALKYLERKRKDEFGPSQDININVYQQLTDDQLESRIKALERRHLIAEDVQEGEIVEGDNG